MSSIIDHTDFIVAEDSDENLYFPDEEQAAIIEEYFDEDAPDRNSILVQVTHVNLGVICIGLDMDYSTLTIFD